MLQVKIPPLRRLQTSPLPHYPCLVQQSDSLTVFDCCRPWLERCLVEQRDNTQGKNLDELGNFLMEERCVCITVLSPFPIIPERSSFYSHRSAAQTHVDRTPFYSYLPAIAKRSGHTSKAQTDTCNFCSILIPNPLLPDAIVIFTTMQG